MKKFLIFALLSGSPSVAAACEFDGLMGFGGMHRLDPFSGARGTPDVARAPVTGPERDKSGIEPRESEPAKMETPIASALGEDDLGKERGSLMLEDKAISS